MNLEQSMRIAISFAREAAKSRRRGLCTACVDVLAVTGAGITLMGGDQAGPLCVSSAAIGELEDAQFMNGAGPCPDAFRLGRPVHAFDFDGDEANRWPSFVHVALAAGIHAAFAFPLSQAGATVGVLSLYQHARGDLSHAQHEDSAAMVEILTETVLSLQDAAPRGVLADGLEGAAEYRAELHQASGMVGKPAPDSGGRGPRAHQSACLRRGTTAAGYCRRHRWQTSPADRRPQRHWREELNDDRRKPAHQRG